MAGRKILSFPDYISVLFVEQEAEGSELTPLQFLIASDTRRSTLQAEETQLMEALKDAPADKVEALTAQLQDVSVLNPVTARLLTCALAGE